MSVKFGDSNIGAEIGTPTLNANITKPSINVNFNAPSLGASGGNTILRELVNPQFFVGTVTTLEPDQDVYCYLTGTKDAPVLNFGIPKGYKGDTGQTGATGQAATIAVGTVTTGQPTDPASVTNSGTSSAAVFNFVIPKGDKGDTGAAGVDGQDGTNGQDGYSPAVTITSITGGHTVNITDKDHPTGQSFNVMDGTTPTVPVTDVTVNGTSVVTSSVAQVVVPEPAPTGGATPSSDTQYGSVGTSTQYARKDHRHTSNFPTTGTPADLGTATNGTAGSYARSDHVHNLPESTFSITLSSANWALVSGETDVYYQTVTVTGGTAKTKVDLQPSYSALQQMLTDGTLGLYIENDNATFKAIALGSAPTANLTIQASRHETL